MVPRISTIAAVVASAALLAACEGTFGTKTAPQKPAAVESSQPATTSSGSSAASSGVGSGSGFQGSVLDDPNNILSKRTVYFDFDKSEIKPEYKAIIEAHAHYLASHPSATITLEGNCDERGTREYNMALGERRAVAVRQMMVLLGASGQQIETVSYGEERPVALGHDEASWAKNRRVDIVYRTR